MKKKQKKLILSNDPEIRTRQIIEYTAKFCEEHKEFMENLAEGPKSGGKE
jgi:hypothetical protein